MKKVKKIAKRLRARADELRLMAAGSARGNSEGYHSLLMAEVLQEVAEQISPPSKKKAKKLKTVKPTTEAKKLPNNGAQHETTADRVGIGAGG